MATTSVPEDRSGDSTRKPAPINFDNMKAKCGHTDPMGYFGGTVCMKCAKRNHKKAMGR